MTANELRQKYLDFMKEKGHSIIPSSSVVPENDPTTLFITAGMHPLVPYLMGEPHPLGKRLADCQKCIRTIDIDEVGDTTHHTFFEMLGNWSLGDYFKKEAIEWSWEFLTSPKWLGLDKNRLACSVFAGDADAPFDQEAFDIWKNLGMPEKKIAKLPKKNNWWGPAGETGPCGPDTEMFYWVGDPKETPNSFNDDNDLWVEIWNDVFMQYNKNTEGKFEKLAQQNVDTGMGLERTLAVLNGFNDNYKTELFWPIIGKIEEVSGKNYEDNKKEFRIIADHIKAAVFIMADGIVPSNIGQGYVLRRLIRRAVFIINKDDMKFDSKKFKLIAQVVFDIYKDVYQEFKQEEILSKFSEEIRKFRATIEKGLKEFNKGTDPFILFTTYGFPIELTKEMAKEKDMKIDEEDFKEKLKKHQELSRTASAGMFKGGLADTKEKTTELHTTAHLMLAGLRKVLGNNVHQKGSNINGERIRFDFSHGEKMTDDQKKKVEEFVNEAINAKVPVEVSEMTPEEAKESGAEGEFSHKYGDRVKVYTIGNIDPSTGSGLLYSKEICGGPHVKNTADIKGTFRIKKEESSSAGVRRIKAVVE